MQRALEFLFDYGSPFSYLVDTQLANVVNRTDAALVYRPQGVHVAYVNVDGAIDMPFIHKLRPDLKREDMLSPDAIAETFWHLAHQDPSAWTQELDVRPFKEKF